MSIDFAKIAPYLKDPLVLIGFFLLLAFSFCRYLIKRGVVPPLPPTLGFRILRTILLYGFILGLLLIGLGFALKYKELQDTNHANESRLAEQRRKDENDRTDRLQAAAAAHEKDVREQQQAVARLQTELDGNLAVAEQLRRNTIVFLNNFNTLTAVTRTPGIKLLDVMFPKENLELKTSDADATGLADRAMDQIRDSGLLSDQLEREKFTAAAQAVSRTIEATLSTAQSLQDPKGKRYSFSSTVWQNDQPTLAKVIVADVTPYQESYNRLALGGISAQDVAFSKDGNWITYVTFPEGDLWRSKNDGSEKRQLTFPPMEVHAPRWSPDGKQIAFMGRDPGEVWRIYLASPEGDRAAVPLPAGPDSQAAPDWSPEGNFLVFSGLPEELSGDSKATAVHMIDVRSHAISTVPGSEGLYCPRWSPSGRYISATSSDGSKLMLFDVSRQSWSKLIDLPEGCPTWSHDDNYLYFQSFDVSSPEFARVRISDGKVEHLANIDFRRNIQRDWFWWNGLTPDGSPLVLRDESTEEIFALDWKLP